jgi:DNA mismatch repair protein MutS
MRPLYEILKQEQSQKCWNDFFSSEQLPFIDSTAPALDDFLSSLENALNLDLDTTRLDELKDYIRPGYNEEFDRLKNIFSLTQSWLETYEEELKAKTAIGNLKIRYNRIYGFYIEVTKTHLNKIPDFFIRRQTMVNAERFTTDILKNKEREVIEADANIEACAKEILDNLSEKIRNQDEFLKVCLDQFAWIDAWAGIKKSITNLSRFGEWARPEILAEQTTMCFELVDSRHPLIEERQGSFVSNSLSLNQNDCRLVLLTGPNMAGKSTLMRQCGICLFLAQCGIFVPASKLKLTPFHSFFSRMGATDKILEGDSTFMVEMKEMSCMLNEMCDRSFLLIDEIGRGTSTQDGLSIAQALLEYLHNQTKAVVIFATHYHELSQVAQRLSNAKNASMSIQEHNGELVFLRSLEWNAAPSSYGIHVAEMAGLPSEILKRSRELLSLTNPNNLELVSNVELIKNSKPQRSKKTSKENKLDNLPLFS